MEPRLGPDRCLRRWCRICGMEMMLEYDSHSEDRVYDYSCTRCGTTVRIFEEIFQQIREHFRSEGDLLEPLTQEEYEEQIIDMEATRKFFDEHPDLAVKGSQKKNWIRDLSYRSESVLQQVLSFTEQHILKGVQVSSITSNKNQAVRSHTLKLGPHMCLRRQCRICESWMELKYEFDSRERRYTFHCARCGTTVHLVEDIIKEMRECWMYDEYILEPLTREEQLRQSLSRQVGQWFFRRFQSDKKSLGGNSLKTKGRNRLSDDEAEKLR